jgi:transcriptional regulator with XRE-family HTH domain
MIMINRQVDEFINSSKEGLSWWVIQLKLDFALQLDKLLEEKGMSQAEFARNLGKSEPYVTKVLRGDSNLTMESMASLARAAGGQVDIKILDMNVQAEPVNWASKIKPLTILKRDTITEATFIGAVSCSNDGFHGHDDRIAA